MQLHIFNIDTDYALADFSPLYTPPKRVVELRSSMALVPSQWCEPGDAILCPDDRIPMTEGNLEKDFTILTPDRLAEHFIDYPETMVAPWGWNPALRRFLLDHGVPEWKLPSAGELEEIRRVSHRRTTINFNQSLNTLLSEAGFHQRHLSPLPIEFTRVDEAIKWELENTPVFFKAPWSSSGRGILFTDSSTPTQIEQWLRGIIRRQGSVMGETAANKILDCATEWHIGEDGMAEFLGVSAFEASRRGKYHFNIVANQTHLMKRIRDHAPDFDECFIECQRKALERVVNTTPDARHRYRGYAGIDMVISPEGSIRGGIELNFRRTMGLIPILKERIGRFTFIKTGISAENV